jgi:hypothetical protein
MYRVITNDVNDYIIIFCKNEITTQKMKLAPLRMRAKK